MGKAKHHTVLPSSLSKECVHVVDSYLLCQTSTPFMLGSHGAPEYKEHPSIPAPAEKLPIVHHIVLAACLTG